MVPFPLKIDHFRASSVAAYIHNSYMNLIYAPLIWVAPPCEELAQRDRGSQKGFHDLIWHWRTFVSASRQYPGTPHGSFPISFVDECSGRQSLKLIGRTKTNVLPMPLRNESKASFFFGGGGCCLILTKLWEVQFSIIANLLGSI